MSTSGFSLASCRRPWTGGHEYTVYEGLWLTIPGSYLLFLCLFLFDTLQNGAVEIGRRKPGGQGRKVCKAPASARPGRSLPALAA
ncbi:hypothetical protein GQ53DRAFT_752331 [Thozetella sp. PMI_491]|nr:hypothetical protein GQ53DRAFT_752331 [Thozetella sp. PMI_491]